MKKCVTCCVFLTFLQADFKTIFCLFFENASMKRSRCTRNQTNKSNHNNIALYFYIHIYSFYRKEAENENCFDYKRVVKEIYVV